MSDTLLQKYKLTKPDTFSVSFNDAIKDYHDWIKDNKQPIPRKSHKWHQNITDYYNYGFNEHTLKIYVHKITQLTEKYREKRKEYAEKCNTSQGTIFDKAQELRKMSKDVYPFDLGGIYIPVDDKVIDFGFKFQVENLYEQYKNKNSNENQDSNQNNRCGESLIYQSKFIQNIHFKQLRYVKEIYKLYQKENKRGLYLFDSAIKIFPIQKVDNYSLPFSNQTLQNLVNSKNFTFDPQKYEQYFDKQVRERSRTPKTKKPKKH